MTAPPSARPVRPSPGPRASAPTSAQREKWARQEEIATNEALTTIAMNFPTLGRKRLGIRLGAAYHNALLRLRAAGLIQKYEPAKLPLWCPHASPRQVLALRSLAPHIPSAE